jgi:hypothetical protein
VIRDFRKPRILSAGLLGLTLIVVACGAGTTELPPTIGKTPPNEVLREPPRAAELQAGDAGAPPSDAGPSAAADAGDGGCAYGRLEDPHRGFVRCLNPDEADAGWLPPSPQAEPSDAGAAPPTEGVAPIVEMGEPSFESGEVPKIDKFLKGVEDGIGKCIAKHGGLSGSAGKMKISFLVRSRGKAEGVEISGAKGVTGEAKECIRLLLKNKNVGAPSAEFVGVNVTVTLKAK